MDNIAWQPFHRLPSSCADQRAGARAPSAPQPGQATIAPPRLARARLPSPAISTPPAFYRVFDVAARADRRLRLGAGGDFDVDRKRAARTIFGVEQTWITSGWAGAGRNMTIFDVREYITVDFGALNEAESTIAAEAFECAFVHFSLVVSIA
jgi:hypothetical protein